MSGLPNGAGTPTKCTARRSDLMIAKGVLDATIAV
jgi:hypothetical protein